MTDVTHARAIQWGSTGKNQSMQTLHCLSLLVNILVMNQVYPGL